METRRLIIVAVGGQGNLLASRVLGEAALLAGIPAHMSEIHGMAQRGGVVESALLFGAAKSTVISDGEADILVGFEPSETLRALNKCHAESVVITNLFPLPPFTVSIGRGTYPDIEASLPLIKKKVGKLIAFDASRLAKRAGSLMSLNMVLLGALIQTGMLGITTDHITTAIKTTTKKAFLDVNLSAFRLGFDASRQQTDGK